MLSDKQDSIQAGKFRVSLPYITILSLVLILLAGGGKLFVFGKEVGVASERLLRLETTTNEKFRELSSSNKEEIEKLKEQIEKLQKQSNKQSEDIAVIKTLLEQLAKKQKNGGG
jgi:flagellar motility protein MotE (MotC chaperone)